MSQEMKNSESCELAIHLIKSKNYEILFVGDVSQEMKNAESCELAIHLIKSQIMEILFVGDVTGNEKL